MSDLDPVRRPGEFVFVEADEGVAGEATVREDEGLTVVLPRERADQLGLAYDYVAAWITLRVDSTLEQVGLTALFSRALADAGISCNVLAGVHHDHLLVPAERAGRGGRRAAGAAMVRWTAAIPAVAFLVMAVTFGSHPGTLVLVVAALLLAGAVLAAVHHAEVVAHRVGEPFGSLVLAVAVTVIEVA